MDDKKNSERAINVLPNLVKNFKNEIFEVGQRKAAELGIDRYEKGTPEYAKLEADIIDAINKHEFKSPQGYSVLDCNNEVACLVGLSSWMFPVGYVGIKFRAAEFITIFTSTNPPESLVEGWKVKSETDHFVVLGVFDGLHYEAATRNGYIHIHKYKGDEYVGGCFFNGHKTPPADDPEKSSSDELAILIARLVFGFCD